jgi:hypothetical protein
LEDVAEIVTAQFGPLNFTAKPDDVRQWDVASTGRLLLRTVIEFDRLVVRGVGSEAAVDALRTSTLGLPAFILKALRSVAPAGRARIVKQIRLKDLSPGMVLEEDLVSPKGIRLVPAGQEVTRSQMVRLSSIAAGVGVAEPFRVLVPT